MESIPLDPWDNKYVYYAPLVRPAGPGASSHNLYLNAITREDTDKNGKLDAGEDIGIAEYANFGGGKRAGAGNGILDHGDDDNKDGTIQKYITASPIPDRLEDYYLEYGNADISPDGLARNLGYYLYSVGRDKIDESATGYEDINLNSLLDAALDVDGGGTFPEDINTNVKLDTGYEDTGIDGIPGTKDTSEGDGELVANEEFGTKSGGPDTWHYNKHSNHDDVLDDEHPGFDIGGDDINSWNSIRPWRENESYGG